MQSVREGVWARFGPLPAEAQWLLLVTELRELGARVGLDTVLVRGDEARLVFRRNAQPRLARLTAALEAVQFVADVRRGPPPWPRLPPPGGGASRPRPPGAAPPPFQKKTHKGSPSARGCYSLSR